MTAEIVTVPDILFTPSIDQQLQSLIHAMASFDTGAGTGGAILESSSSNTYQPMLVTTPL